MASLIVTYYHWMWPISEDTQVTTADWLIADYFFYELTIRDTPRVVILRFDDHHVIFIWQVGDRHFIVIWRFDDRHVIVIWQFDDRHVIVIWRFHHRQARTTSAKI